MSRVMPVSATRPADWRALARLSAVDRLESVMQSKMTSRMADALHRQQRETAHLANRGVYNTNAVGVWTVLTPSGRRQVVGQRVCSRPAWLYHAQKDLMPEMFDGTPKAQRLTDQWLTSEEGRMWAMNTER